MSARRVLGIMVLADLVLPLVTYYLLLGVGVGSVVALACGAAISAGRVAIAAIRARHLDVVAAVVLCFFALGLAGLLLSRNPEIALATNSLPTVAIGLWCLGSLLVGRAFCYSLFLPLLTGGRREFEGFWHQAWRDAPTFRHSLRMLTLGWGCLLVSEAVARLLLDAVLPVDLMVTASSVLQIVLVIAILGFTGWYARRTGLGIRPYLDAVGVSWDGSRA